MKNLNYLMIPKFPLLLSVHIHPHESYDSIETFEEAMNEVENAKKKYSATMHWTKSYTKAYIHFNRTTSEYHAFKKVLYLFLVFKIGI